MDRHHPNAKACIWALDKCACIFGAAILIYLKVIREAFVMHANQIAMLRKILELELFARDG